MTGHRVKTQDTLLISGITRAVSINYNKYRTIGHQVKIKSIPLINPGQLGIKSRPRIHSYIPADSELSISGLSLTTNMLFIGLTYQNTVHDSQRKENFQDTTFNSGQLGIKSRPRLLSFFHDSEYLGIKSRPTQADPALPNCRTQITNKLKPQDPRLLVYAPADPALQISGPSSLSPTTLDTPAPPMLDMPALPTLVSLAPPIMDSPTLSTGNFSTDVVLPQRPSFITSGPSNPHDPGPSAAVADYTVTALTQLAFFIIAIYALIDFLCIPPR
jgi:hypothetical protein